MRLYWIALLVLLLSPSAHASTGNCSAAHTPREKLVCSSPTLSVLDGQLNKSYEAALAQLTPASAAAVRADQRDWLAWLDKVCPANNPAIDQNDCLSTNYKARNNELTEGIGRRNGFLFFTRNHLVYTPGKAPPKGADEAKFDPGFGTGDFTWPQIDAPDRDRAPFNEAVYKAAIQAETSSSVKNPSSFETGTVAAESLQGTFFFFAVNEHFIDVVFARETYPWGAAHPGTDRTSFLWSVDGHRALSLNDILRPGSEHNLIEAALTKLRATDAGPNLWDGKELSDGVAAALANPAQWDVSSGGLTLTFAQYQVTCYACGTPEITFSWTGLAPYLLPGFDTNLLPKREPGKQD